jgi:glycerol dehydrogenase-like iron-containing ADH family enzyme
VVRNAPSYLNTAGLGDILCSQAGISEWEYSSKRNLSPPVDSSKTLSVRNQRNHIVGHFPNTLDANGSLTSESIKFIMESIQKRDSNSIQSPYAPGTDHIFWQCVESTNNRGWVHGGGVALASVIIAWHCEEGVRQLISDLDVCQVLWRPAQLNIEKHHIQAALAFAPEFFNDKDSGRNVKSILRENPITGSRFEQLWIFLNS